MRDAGGGQDVPHGRGASFWQGSGRGAGDLRYMAGGHVRYKVTSNTPIVTAHRCHATDGHWRDAGCFKTHQNKQAYTKQCSNQIARVGPGGGTRTDVAKFPGKLPGGLDDRGTGHWVDHRI